MRKRKKKKPSEKTALVLAVIAGILAVIDKLLEIIIKLLAR